MIRRKRNIRIYVRNKMRYNPEAKVYDFLHVDIDNFAGTTIGDIKEDVKRRCGNSSLKIDDLYLNNQKLADDRSVAHYNLEDGTILETTSNPLWVTCLNIKRIEVEREQAQNPNDKNTQNWTQRSLLRKKTLLSVLLNSKKEFQSQPPHFPEVEDLVIYLERLGKKGAQMNPNYTQKDLQLMYQDYMSHDIGSDDPIGSFIHRNAVRLGLRQPGKNHFDNRGTGNNGDEEAEPGTSKQVKNKTPRAPRNRNKDRWCEDCESNIAELYCPECQNAQGGQGLVLCRHCSQTLHLGAARRRHDVKDITQAPKTSNPYIPHAFKAPFALLVGMYSGLTDRPPRLSMTEKEIKLRAQPLTDTDLQDKQNGRYVGGFECMENSLILKGLVQREASANPTYALTETGQELAEILFSFQQSVQRYMRSHDQPQQIPQHYNTVCGSRKVCLIIDEQERDRERLLELAAKNNIEAQVRRLPAGDYLWILTPPLTVQHVKYTQCQPAMEMVLPFIVERKSWDDLEDSIKTKRFQKQVNNMLESGLICYYLLEGYVQNLKYKATEQHQKFLKGQVEKLLLDHGFYLSYTGSWFKSAVWLMWFTQIVTDLHKTGILKDRNVSYSTYLSRTSGQRVDNVLHRSDYRGCELNVWTSHKFIDSIFSDWYKEKPLLDLVKEETASTGVNKHLLVIQGLENYNKKRQSMMNKCLITAYDRPNIDETVKTSLNNKHEMLHYDVMCYLQLRIQVMTQVYVVRTETNDETQRLQTEIQQRANEGQRLHQGQQRLVGGQRLQAGEDHQNTRARKTPQKRKQQKDDIHKSPGKATNNYIEQDDYPSDPQTEDFMLQQALALSTSVSEPGNNKSSSPLNKNVSPKKRRSSATETQIIETDMYDQDEELQIAIRESMKQAELRKKSGKRVAVPEPGTSALNNDIVTSPESEVSVPSGVASEDEILQQVLKQSLEEAKKKNLFLNDHRNHSHPEHQFLEQGKLKTNAPSSPTKQTLKYSNKDNDTFDEDKELRLAIVRSKMETSFLSDTDTTSGNDIELNKKIANRITLTNTRDLSDSQDEELQLVLKQSKVEYEQILSQSKCWFSSQGNKAKNSNSAIIEILDSQEIEGQPNEHSLTDLGNEEHNDQILSQSKPRTSSQGNNATNSAIIQIFDSQEIEEQQNKQSLTDLGSREYNGDGSSAESNIVLRDSQDTDSEEERNGNLDRKVHRSNLIDKTPQSENRTEQLTSFKESSKTSNIGISSDSKKCETMKTPNRKHRICDSKERDFDEKIDAATTSRSPEYESQSLSILNIPCFDDCDSNDEDNSLQFSLEILLKQSFDKSKPESVENTGTASASRSRMDANLFKCSVNDISAEKDRRKALVEDTVENSSVSSTSKTDTDLFKCSDENKPAEVDRGKVLVEDTQDIDRFDIISDVVRVSDSDNGRFEVMKQKKARCDVSQGCQLDVRKNNAIVYESEDIDVIPPSPEKNSPFTGKTLKPGHFLPSRSPKVASSSPLTSIKNRDQTGAETNTGSRDARLENLTKFDKNVNISKVSGFQRQELNIGDEKVDMSSVLEKINDISPVLSFKDKSKAQLIDEENGLQNDDDADDGCDNNVKVLSPLYEDDVDCCVTRSCKFDENENSIDSHNFNHQTGSNSLDLPVPSVQDNHLTGSDSLDLPSPPDNHLTGSDSLDLPVPSPQDISLFQTKDDSFSSSKSEEDIFSNDNDRLSDEEPVNGEADSSLYADSAKDKEGSGCTETNKIKEKNNWNNSQVLPVNIKQEKVNSEENEDSFLLQQSAGKEIVRNIKMEPSSPLTKHNVRDLPVCVKELKQETKDIDEISAASLPVRVAGAECHDSVDDAELARQLQEEFDREYKLSKGKEYEDNTRITRSSGNLSSVDETKNPNSQVNSEKIGNKHLSSSVISSSDLVDVNHVDTQKDEELAKMLHQAEQNKESGTSSRHSVGIPYVDTQNNKELAKKLKQAEKNKDAMTSSRHFADVRDVDTRADEELAKMLQQDLNKEAKLEQEVSDFECAQQLQKKLISEAVSPSKNPAMLNDRKIVKNHVPRHVTFSQLMDSEHAEQRQGVINGQVNDKSIEDSDFELAKRLQEDEERQRSNLNHPCNRIDKDMPRSPMKRKGDNSTITSSPSAKSKKYFQTLDDSIPSSLEALWNRKLTSVRAKEKTKSASQLEQIRRERHEHYQSSKSPHRPASSTPVHARYPSTNQVTSPYKTATSTPVQPRHLSTNQVTSPYKTTSSTPVYARYPSTNQVTSPYKTASSTPVYARYPSTNQVTSPYKTASSTPVYARYPSTNQVTSPYKTASSTPVYARYPSTNQVTSPYKTASSTPVQPRRSSTNQMTSPYKRVSSTSVILHPTSENYATSPHKRGSAISAQPHPTSQNHITSPYKRGSATSNQSQPASQDYMTSPYKRASSRFTQPTSSSQNNATGVKRPSSHTGSPSGCFIDLEDDNDHTHLKFGTQSPPSSPLHKPEFTTSSSESSSWYRDDSVPSNSTWASSQSSTKTDNYDEKFDSSASSSSIQSESRCNVKCSVCGEKGHTRVWKKCPKYFSREEMAHRQNKEQKRKQEAEEKAKKEQKTRDELKHHENALDAIIAQMQQEKTGLSETIKELDKKKKQRDKKR